MASDYEFITIHRCPLCEGSHRYKLEIERATSMGLMETNQTEARRIYRTRLFTCPIKDENFQARFALAETSETKVLTVRVVGLAKNEGEIEFLGVSHISPHNEAIYEAGKTLLTESIGTTREFCESMISLSIGAIPVYLGLLKFILPDNYSMGIVQGAIASAPAIIFLLASVVFAVGLIPRKSYFSLDLIEEIEQARTEIISRRSKLIKLGFIMFVIATFSATVVVVLNLG